MDVGDPSLSMPDGSGEDARSCFPGEMSIIGTSSDAATVSLALGVMGNATGSESNPSVGVEARVDAFDAPRDSVGAMLMLRGV